MIEHFVIGMLMILIIGQNVFWAKVCLNLTNRIMSRNYAELTLAEAKPTLQRPQEEDFHDPIAERQAQDLNSMLGMV